MLKEFKKFALKGNRLFLSGLLNFIIMAFVVFMLVKWINKLKKPELVAAATTKKCPHCFSDINLNATKCPFCTSDIIR